MTDAMRGIVGVGLDGIDWNVPDLLDRLARAFHRRHEELYTYALPDQEAVLVNARVAVIGVLSDPPREPGVAERRAAEQRELRRVYLGGWTEVSVFDFEPLAAGQVIEGPAIIESATTTVLLRPGDRGHATAQGWLDIAVAAP